MRTIDWDSDAIVIIDQTCLPCAEVYLRLDTVPDLVDAIRRLAVRGAMALGVAGAMGVALAAQGAQAGEVDLDGAVRRAADALRQARPTAVNLAWGIDRALSALPGGPNAILAEALRVRDEDVTANKAIGERGADFLAPLGRLTLLTHCNAGALAGVEWGTALSVVHHLHQRGLVEEVLVPETRPLLQGARLTAWELARAQIPHRIIVDGAGAGLLLAGVVDAVVVGADRVAANGDTANKVGTVAHALAAHRAQVPFLVAAPESTVDADTPSGATIPIEERDPAEVLSWAGSSTSPVGSAAYNPAFDITPADLITGLVTEHRVVRLAAGEHPITTSIVGSV